MILKQTIVSPVFFAPHGQYHSARVIQSYPDKFVDTLFAILAVGIFALLPIVGSAGLAWRAITALRSYQIRTTRWMTLPLILIVFSLICFAVTAWTLSYSPHTKPGVLDPILVFLVLDGVLLLPVALITLLHGLVSLRDKKIEAGLDLVAVVLYGSLYFTYIPLQNYFPHV